MCGIYTIGTSKGGSRPVPDQKFEKALQAILAYDPGSGSPTSLHPAMDELRESSYLFLTQGPQLRLVEDGSLVSRIAEAASSLEDWLKRMEVFREKSAGVQTEEEALNRLITGARDTVWQIRRDALQNAEKIPGLLSGDAPSENALSHAWHLNLILNNLDRLEVRGRDSAGIAVYVYFQDAGARKKFISDPDVASALPSYAPKATFGNNSVTLPPSNRASLLFAFKVAREVGEIGENVSELRKHIRSHSIFQKALRTPGTTLFAMAHTRWASNGIISVPNCHPVDSTTLHEGRLSKASQGRFVAALNGDVDNFQELREELQSIHGQIHPRITTDAKLVPVLMDYLCRQGKPIEEAFEETVCRCNGSLAIAVLAAELPGQILVARKGSGQGLFIGDAGDSVAAASEMYGLVELTGRYIKVEGELEKDGKTVGERFQISFSGEKPAVLKLEGNEKHPVGADRFCKAEITTRDIDRGSYPRYLLKEIHESVQSVKNTCSGKLVPSPSGTRLSLGEKTLPSELLSKFKTQHIRKIVVIGQGTAAIAGQGIAYLLDKSLGNAGLSIQAAKATELSGSLPSKDMRDTLVIAVSQSGTTTDTNRTVDLLRSKGAYVLAIVNRRNSDLVYKANSVLYTSDGRDIEMSVASTKAFYSQCVAGQLLALSLAQELNTLTPESLQFEIQSLQRLPEAMSKTLQLSPQVSHLAKTLALKHRHWAIVGSGPEKIAADEIRIKLSELCYKAIAVDFLEDKKHIDLSSEPLCLVCAACLDRNRISDAVKEVAIFNAHSSKALVIAQEGEKRFTPYGAGCIHVPRYKGNLAFLLPVMVGHLFGYYAADSFEDAAKRLRRARSRIVDMDFQLTRSGAEKRPAELLQNDDLVGEFSRIEELLSTGGLDSGLEARTAVKLQTVLEFFLGRFKLDILPRKFRCPGTVRNLLNVALEVLSASINEITRPIDAIKHQAKTVTVGISRLEEVRHTGAVWSLVEELGLPAGLVPTSVAAFLSAFGELVREVEGSTLYGVTDLSPLGQPTSQTKLYVVESLGSARAIPSRYDTAKPVSGTKRHVLQEGRHYLGLGQKDGRSILIVPFVSSQREGHLLLVHLELIPYGDQELRLEALKTDEERYDRLVASVTENDVSWFDELINRVDNTTLFLKDIKETSQAIIRAQKPRLEALHTKRGKET